jgi:hypothetical protein
LHQCEVNLEFADYDLRHVGHLAACEGHYAILEYLATETTFDFEKVDRWGNDTFSEMYGGHRFSGAQVKRIKEAIKARKNKI